MFPNIKRKKGVGEPPPLYHRWGYDLRLYGRRLRIGLYWGNVRFLKLKRVEDIYLYTLKAMSIGFLQEHKFWAVTIRLISSTFHCCPLEFSTLSTSFVKFLSPGVQIKFF